MTLVVCSLCFTSSFEFVSDMQETDDQSQTSIENNSVRHLRLMRITVAVAVVPGSDLVFFDNDTGRTQRFARGIAT